MPAIAIQLLEAVAYAAAAIFGVYGATHDVHGALAAGATTFAGKLSPRQLVGTSSAPPQT